MKKFLAFLSLSILLVSCNKEASKENSLKTAYINTTKLIEGYKKFTDEDEKFKVKSDEMSRPLESKFKAFQNEANGFEANARAKGMAWAQQKGAELQRREQELSYEQNALLQQLQAEGNALRDSIISEVKEYVKVYGKKNGYDYLYGTGDAATIMYAKDQYDITADLVKELNANYAKANGTEAVEEKEVKKDDH